MRTSLVVVLLALALVSCSAKADFERVCNAEALSGVTETDPSQRAMLIAQWIQANVRSSDARQAMAALASASPEMRGKLLKQAAHEAGYDGPCPMADQ